MKTKLSILLFLLLFLSGCFQINTDDPDKAFKYWARIPLSNEEVTVFSIPNKCVNKVLKTMRFLCAYKHKSEIAKKT